MLVVKLFLVEMRCVAMMKQVAIMFVTDSNEADHDITACSTFCLVLSH